MMDNQAGHVPLEVHVGTIPEHSLALLGLLGKPTCHNSRGGHRSYFSRRTTENAATGFPRR